MSLPAVMQHLQVLEAAGLVSSEKPAGCGPAASSPPRCGQRRPGSRISAPPGKPGSTGSATTWPGPPDDSQGAVHNEPSRHPRLVHPRAQLSRPARPGLRRLGDPAPKSRWFAPGPAPSTSSTSGWAAARSPPAAPRAARHDLRVALPGHRPGPGSSIPPPCRPGPTSSRSRSPPWSSRPRDGGTRLVLTEQGASSTAGRNPRGGSHGTADQLEALAAELKAEHQ